MNFFGIASRMNNREFLVAKEEPFGPIGFNSLDAAKYAFKPYYDLLTLNRNSKEYLSGISRLILLAPAIYTVGMDELITVIAEWREGLTAYKPDPKFLSVPHLVAPMKKGFLEKYMALDILKDIERSVTVGPNGTMHLQEFKVRHLKDGEAPSPVEPLTEEKAEEFLRKRGLR